MSNTIQEATMALFNAVELPSPVQPACLGYVDLLVASPKKSILYYTTEEHDAIPWWSLRRGLQEIPRYPDDLWAEIWRQIARRLDRRQPVILSVDDYVIRRYGKRAYRAAYFYSNAHGGIVGGNALVDTVIRHGPLRCPVSFELHQKNGPFN